MGKLDMTNIERETVQRLTCLQAIEERQWTLKLANQLVVHLGREQTAELFRNTPGHHPARDYVLEANRVTNKVEIEMDELKAEIKTLKEENTRKDKVIVDLEKEINKFKVTSDEKEQAYKDELKTLKGVIEDMKASSASERSNNDRQSQNRN